MLNVVLTPEFQTSPFDRFSFPTSHILYKSCANFKMKSGCYYLKLDCNNKFPRFAKQEI